jgi:hypothetical protein
MYSYINFLEYTPKISCFAASVFGYVLALVFSPIALRAFADQPAVFERYKRPYDFNYKLAVKLANTF